MMDRGINRAAGSRKVQAACAALLLLLTRVPASSIEGLDPHILPASPRYMRNAQCDAVQISMPPSTHRLPGSNLISPKPTDVPVGQGESAICFAYATADMISQRIGRAVSPLDVATKFYFADPPNSQPFAIQPCRRICEAHPTYLADIAWSRNAADISTDHNPGLHPYFDKLEGGEEDAAALLYNLGGLCEERDLPSHEGYAHFTSYYAALRYSSYVRAPNQCFRRVGATVDKLRSRRADAFNDAWLRQVEALCQRKPLPVPLLPVSYRVAANQLEFMEMLEEGQPRAPRTSVACCPWSTTLSITVARRPSATAGTCWRSAIRRTRTLLPTIRALSSHGEG